MAAIMYHPGLQTHLESQLVESRTLMLMLPSPKQSIDLAFKSCFHDSNMFKTNHHEENINKTETYQNKPNNGGWNFLDSLSNISQNTSKKETTTTYMLSQQKRSSLVLSPKSLELCTENLGSESGTDIVENDMLLSSLGTMEQREPCRRVLVATKKVKTQNFPPPLTTIRGSESLRVRPRREDGRLVIEVAKVPPSTSCFQADRSNGRLRLCFSTNQTTSFEPEEDVDDVIDENEEPHNEEEYSQNEMIGGEIQDAETEEKTEEDKGVVTLTCECEEMNVRMEKYESIL
ncbi:protein FANTASTIC FOUR 3-like [Trifolium pratense]|uniref:protein FANTASTIC FOUR 3-like n=1 Tax=Trifolium pratense TaxID=57577 RepID=UPI001E69131A|nr:protein FANTASTIC FOUR 3-like [Trifolium pratense]